MEIRRVTLVWGLVLSEVDDVEALLNVINSSGSSLLFIDWGGF